MIKKLTILAIFFLAVTLFITACEEKQETIKREDPTAVDETHKKVLAIYNEARRYYDRGKFDEAIKSYLKVIEDYPEDILVPYARFELGMCYANLRLYDTAYYEWRTLIDEFPKHNATEKAYYYMAKLLAEKMQMVRARELFYQQLDAFPEGKYAARARAYLKSINDQFDASGATKDHVEDPYSPWE